jgi:excisionase family DNA binding protein
MALLDEGLLSIKSAAAWLDVSPSTIWRMMDGGEVPFVYAPGRGSLARRIPKRALVEWAERRLLGAGQ